MNINILMLPFLILAGCAPFGVTLLGWIAVMQIRRSGGRLYGMGLALFDGLLFPLLALDGLIFGIWYVVIKLAAVWLDSHHFRPLEFHHVLILIWILLALLSSTAVDFLIIRAVWRAVNKPLPVAGPPQSGTGVPPVSPSMYWQDARATSQAVVPPTASADQRQRAMQDVRIPAIGMRIAAAINLLIVPAVLLLPFIYLLTRTPAPIVLAPTMEAAPATPGAVGATPAASGGMIMGRIIILIVPLLLVIIFNTIIIWGAGRMMRLRGYGSAVAASILAMLAVPGNLIGLPMGIWALVVLSRREVKEAFASELSNNQAAVPPAPSKTAKFGWWPIGLSVGFHAFLLLLAMVGLMLLVVPKFGQIFADFSASVPFSTRCVIAISRFLEHGGYLLAPLLLAVDFLICWFAQSLGGRKLLVVWSLMVTIGFGFFVALTTYALFQPMSQLIYQVSGTAASLPAGVMNPQGAAPEVPTTTRAASRLQFRLGRSPHDTTSPVDELSDPLSPGGKLQLLKPVLLDESAIAFAAFDPTPINTAPPSDFTAPSINLFFTRSGAEAFAKIPHEIEHLGDVTLDHLPLVVLWDSKIFHVNRFESEKLSGGCIVWLTPPASRADAETLVAALNALNGRVPPPVKVFHSPAEVLTYFPAEAQPDPHKGWDDFTMPKADKWLEENISGHGFKIVFEAVVKDVELKRISPKDQLNETLRWDADLTLERIPFEFNGQKAALKLNSYQLNDPNATTFTIFQPNAVVTVSGDEAFARRVKTFQAGDRITICGTISKAAVWSKNPPELWILLSEPSVVFPSSTIPATTQAADAIALPATTQDATSINPHP